MKKKYQNGFFIFGLVLLGIMVTQLDFAEVWRGLQHTGYWFFAVLALWMALYTLNTSAWYIIIKAGQGQETTNSTTNGKRINCFGLRLKLCHTWRTYGGRTLPHYVACAEDWYRASFLFGYTLRHDAHFQPFLVLACLHRLVFLHATINFGTSHHCFGQWRILLFGALVLYDRLPQRACVQGNAAT